MRLLTCAITCVVLAVGTSCASDPPVVATGVTPTATAPLPPPPPPADSMDHDDVYKVGLDIAPGVWHTEGPRRRFAANGGPISEAPANPCYWQRNGPSDTALAAATGLGPIDVTINPSDGTFVTRGCRPWHLKG